MRMSPINQPLMLMELLGHGFAGQQPARPSAEHRPADAGKRMVGRVLNGDGITRYGDRVYTLIGAEELSNSERETLLQLCRQRLDGFREQRGEELFAHHCRHRSPISSSMKDRVLTRARGRCDFRGLQTSYALREAGCVFCALEGSSRVLLERPQPGDSAAACCGWDGIAPA